MCIKWKERFEKLLEKTQEDIQAIEIAYDHDMKIMEDEIEAIKKDYVGILEKRDLEAKKKEKALHQEIEALQKKNKERREKGETQKDSRVSSDDDSVSPADEDLGGYSDEKMGELIKGLGLERYFVVYTNREREKTPDGITIFRIMYREGITDAEIGHLGKRAGRLSRSRYYSDTEEERIRIVELIKESMRKMKKKKSR